jgi:starvation-inducible DNA-binding protein
VAAKTAATVRGSSHNGILKMSLSTITRTDAAHLKEPIIPSARGETQDFSLARRNPLALDASTAAASIDNVNQLLADTLTLRDLYKKHHWQASGPTFYIIHLLFDKHFQEQSKLVDLLAERVQTLGGVSIAMAPDVAEATLIPRAPKGREDTATQISRLLQAHEVILLEARAMARDSAASGDLGTNDIIVSDVIRTNELQVWFLAEHVQ